MAINHPAARPQSIALGNPQEDDIGLRQVRRVSNRMKTDDGQRRMQGDALCRANRSTAGAALFQVILDQTSSPQTSL